MKGRKWPFSLQRLACKIDLCQLSYSTDKKSNSSFILVRVYKICFRCYHICLLVVQYFKFFLRKDFKLKKAKNKQLHPS